MPKENAATISVSEAAKRIGIGRNQAYEAVKRGEIPSIKIGQRFYVPKIALERFLSAEKAHG